jgi:hypothetical protein
MLIHVDELIAALMGGAVEEESKQVVEKAWKSLLPIEKVLLILYIHGYSIHEESLMLSLRALLHYSNKES